MNNQFGDWSMIFRIMIYVIVVLTKRLRLWALRGGVIPPQGPTVSPCCPSTPAWSGISSRPRPTTQPALLFCAHPWSHIFLRSRGRFPLALFPIFLELSVLPGHKHFISQLILTLLPASRSQPSLRLPRSQPFCDVHLQGLFSALPTLPLWWALTSFRLQQESRTLFASHCDRCAPWPVRPQPAEVQHSW